MEENFEKQWSYFTFTRDAKALCAEVADRAKNTVRGHFGTINFRVEQQENFKTVQTKPGLIKQYC